MMTTTIFNDMNSDKSPNNFDTQSTFNRTSTNLVAHKLQKKSTQVPRLNLSSTHY